MVWFVSFFGGLGRGPSAAVFVVPVGPGGSAWRPQAVCARTRARSPAVVQPVVVQSSGSRSCCPSFLRLARALSRAVRSPLPAGPAAASCAVRARAPSGALRSLLLAVSEAASSCCPCCFLRGPLVRGVVVSEVGVGGQLLAGAGFGSVLGEAQRFRRVFSGRSAVWSVPRQVQAQVSVSSGPAVQLRRWCGADGSVPSEAPGSRVPRPPVRV